MSVLLDCSIIVVDDVFFASQTRVNWTHPKRSRFGILRGVNTVNMDQILHLLCLPLVRKYATYTG